MEPNYRRCVSCRKIAPKPAFWRLVRVHTAQADAPQVVQLDHGMGRSAYLCPQATCLQLAEKKNRLGRSLKAAVPEALYQTLQQRLADHKATDHEDTVNDVTACSTVNSDFAPDLSRRI